MTDGREMTLTHPALEPLTLTETSVTERADFRQCRRRWFLNTVKRLQPTGGSPAFWFGNLMHYALEHYYLGAMSDDPEERSIDAREDYGWDAYEHYLEASFEDLKHELGFLWETASVEYLEMAEMGRGMLDGYYRMERETEGIGTVIAVEERYRVPIRTSSGRVFPHQPELTGRFDLIVERKGGDIWIIDHKTASQKHSSAYLDLDDQLTGYAYVFWRATGRLARGQVYNVLLKKVPRKPKVLKDGRLSTDKAQATTYTLYLAAIKEQGLDRRDYEPMLEYLKAKDWSDFYIQEGVFRNLQQLREFERNLAHEWKDMRDVAAHPEKAYPSPSSFNCPSCPVKMICATMQDGGDAEAIIDQNFTIAPPRR